MANQEHVKAIKQGVHYWNKWREENPDVVPDLAWADLVGVDLKFRRRKYEACILQERYPTRCKF